MTIGWAIIIVAVLYLLEKYGLLKKALLGSGVTLAAIVVGYGIFVSCVLLKDKWDEHHKPPLSKADNDALAAQFGGVPSDASPQESAPDTLPADFFSSPAKYQGTPPPQGTTVGPNSVPKGWVRVGTITISYPVGSRLPKAQESSENLMLIRIPPPDPPPPPDGSAWIPVVSGNEFPFKRLGSKQYSKAICYNEARRKTSSVMYFDDKTAVCSDGILMEEVK